ncbi:MAG: CCA tRNA nucleotidyltransferase [Bryobacterales bacterium]|nr:CCA tRNA nucleotidyltransferase [Bryobacterales bacterium]
MSDYMFMLESHLSPDQNRAVAAVQLGAAKANVNLFLTGGAMRDMLGGFRVRDLDFVVEGNALKVAQSVAESAEARIEAADDRRRVADLLFPGGVTVQIGMARQERSARAGARPQVAPATIQEDLRRRDFTINAIALSLARASRGLLLDPLNGLADLQNRELRTAGPYSFADDPSRLLRFVRLKTRLGFQVDPRTQSQYDNARRQMLEKGIPARTLLGELRQAAGETNFTEVVQAFAAERLLSLYSPALEGAKLNLAGLARLEKIRRLLPAGEEHRFPNLEPFLFVLCEKLAPRERDAFSARIGMTTAERNAWQKLPARTRKLAAGLRAPGLRRPSQVYQLLSRAPGEEIVFVLYHDAVKLAQERIRNYLQKYLPLALETSDSEVDAGGAAPGSARFQKAREELIARRLNERPKKVEPPAEDPQSAHP